MLIPTKVAEKVTFITFCVDICSRYSRPMGHSFATGVNDLPCTVELKLRPYASYPYPYTQYFGQLVYRR